MSIFSNQPAKKMTHSIRSVALTAALLSAFCVQAAPVSYDFSETLLYGGLPGAVVSGQFTGDANGNLITNLGNISVSVNGVAVPKPLGQLFSYRIPDGGPAVASFDGAGNNFKISDYVGSFYFASTGTAPDQIFYNGQTTYYSAGDWSVTRADGAPLSVPEPASLALIGLGFVGLGVARRRPAAKATRARRAGSCRLSEAS